MSKKLIRVALKRNGGDHFLSEKLVPESFRHTLGGIRKDKEIFITDLKKREFWASIQELGRAKKGI